VSRPPDFDQLIGSDVDGSERARLRRIHSLLVQAGPPPEISPSMAAGPTLAMTLARRPRRNRRRVMLLAATIAVLAAVFLAGYVTGNGGGGTATLEVMKLSGTPAAPAALASLQIEPADSAGNWPMRLSVTGLPKLKGGAYYEVYLMRDGKPFAPCGSFKVSTKQATVVDLNAPYRLQKGDTWVVTMQTSTTNEQPGRIVMRPV
jgi:Anti-sigma-K factor rskA